MSSIDWNKEFSWVNFGGGSVKPEDIENSVNKYLTENPPTVTEGSITPDKLDVEVQKNIEDSVKTTTEVTRILDEAPEEFDTFKEVADGIKSVQLSIPSSLSELHNDAGYINEDDAMESADVNDIWDKYFK